MTSRGVWVQDPRTGELLPKHLYTRETQARSSLAAPMLIRDQLDAVWNPVNGRTYDSKRAYEKAVRAAGCEIIGNETQKHNPRAQMPDPAIDVKEALDQIEARAMKPRKKKRAK